MNEDILKKLESQQEIITKIHDSVEKTRKYFMWTLIVSLIVFVLPLIGLMFAIPAYLRMIGSLVEL